MTLLDLLFGKVEPEPPVPMRPDPVPVEVSLGGVCAPATGRLVPMAQISDRLFASGAMGPGVGVKPVEGIVYAPVTGTVTVLPNTLHAVGLSSDDGIELLIHVGVDTVNLRGEGFVGFVELGQRVAAGEALMAVDLQAIAAEGCDDVVITVITNDDDFAGVSVAARETVAAGETIMRTARE